MSTAVLPKSSTVIAIVIILAVAWAPVALWHSSFVAQLHRPFFVVVFVIAILALLATGFRYAETLKSDDYRADWEAYSESEGTGTATLGDHFRNR